MAEVYCTKAHPWDGKHGRATGDRVVHPDAHEVGDQQDGYPGGDIVTLQCPHCGHEWQEELPQ